MKRERVQKTNNNLFSKLIKTLSSGRYLDLRHHNPNKKVFILDFWSRLNPAIHLSCPVTAINIEVEFR